MDKIINNKKRVYSNIYNIIIGIDPDVDKNGVAIYNATTKKIDLQSLTFPCLMDFLKDNLQQQSTTDYIIVIEAGWINKAHWHLTPYDTKQSAAAKGNSTGRNHEVGRKIAEMCEHMKLNYKLIKPLQKTISKFHLWKGKDGKITHEELVKLVGSDRITSKRSNQEERDAALIAFSINGYQ